MKLVLVASSLVVLCLAVMYGVPQYQRSREAARRQRTMQEEQLTEDRTPLVLDAKTQAILSGADRVETFRLVDDDEDEDEVGAPVPVSPMRLIHHYQVLRVGPVQDKAFAAALRAALAQVPSPVGKNGLMSEVPSCFEPGVAFRVWEGGAHVDMCVCFHCGGVQVFTQNPPHRFSQEIMADLGASCPAFLVLSKQAFPQDARLAALH